MSTPVEPKRADDIMTKAIGTASPSPENSVRGEKKKKFAISKIFSTKKNSRESSDEDLLQSDENEFDKIITCQRREFRGFSEKHTREGIQSLNLSSFDQSKAPATIGQDIRVFVATWNVGGHTPNHGLNLEEFLQVEGSVDIYVLGFQEIVPLSAGNVLVIEDNEPASKWLALVSHALNKSYHESMQSSSDHNSSTASLKNDSKDIFRKPSLKALHKSLKGDSDFLKSCNCSKEKSHSGMPYTSQSDPSINEYFREAEIDDSRLNYQVVASKQMVGLFLSVWARKEVVKDIGHLRTSCMGRGIMGCLGNKGCISISMTVHQTSFCFVCSHLASGQKEGDELRRNSDVVEILKGTHFSRICKNPSRRDPERIIDHDRVIWLGDLNYRVGMRYEEAILLLEDNDWDTLLEKDQLNNEREAGRVFSGWSEGKILFAPTYKYSHNSDSYAGETTKSKKKRRTPAWCDRVLWRGKGIEQLSYIRGESRLSDHRPVCASFAVEVEMANKGMSKFRKGYSLAGTRSEFENCVMPQRHSFCDF